MLATFVYYHCNICNATFRSTFCNIQTKHLKHRSETPKTLKTQHHRRPQPIWWGTMLVNKLGSGGRREQRPSVHLGAGTSAGLPFPSTCEVDGGAGVHASPAPLPRWVRWMEMRHEMVVRTVEQPGMRCGCCIVELEKAATGRCAACCKRPFIDTPEKTSNFF